MTFLLLTFVHKTLKNDTWFISGKRILKKTDKICYLKNNVEFKNIVVTPSSYDIN